MSKTKYLRWAAGLVSLLFLVACGSGGSGDPSGASPPGTQGIAVDPYITGAQFKEIGPDGKSLQYSTPSDSSGRFSFERPVQAGSVVTMVPAQRGEHLGKPFNGLLQRRVDSAGEGELVVSPLTTLEASGLDAGEIVEALSDAGLELDAADLFRNPMEGLEERAGLREEHLKILQANVAVHAMLVAMEGYPAADSAPRAVERPLDGALLRSTVMSAREMVNADRVQEMRESIAGETFDRSATMKDFIEAAVETHETVVEQMREERRLHGRLPAEGPLREMIRDALTRLEECLRDRLNTPPAPPAPEPTPEPAPADGQALFQAHCAACHTVSGGGRMDLSGKGGQVQSKLPGHRGIQLSAEEIGAIVDYVTPSSPGPAPEPAPLTGEELYAAECATCHGALATTNLSDRTAAGIESAIAADAGGMGTLSLTAEEIQKIADVLPALAPAPEPTPEPTPFDGEAFFQANCSNCHTVGQTTGTMDLAGKADQVKSKLPGHMGVQASAEEEAALADYVQGTASPTPEPTPEPTPVDGETFFQANCSNCHTVGQTTGTMDLAGKADRVKSKLPGHMGVQASAEEEAALADYVQGINAPAPEPNPEPAPEPTPGDCTACHGFPPTSGAHQVHLALPGVDGCATCHGGAEHMNDWVDIGIDGAFDAKSGMAGDNFNGTATCVSVSCHGGQTTPDWETGNINVNSDCTACHQSGTGQFNGYFSGKHSKHLNEGVGCTDCHDTGKLGTHHFNNLQSTTMEGPASGTIRGYINYNGANCTVTCHGEEHRGDRW